MSDRSRNRNYPQNTRKNTKKTRDSKIGSETPHNLPWESPKNHADSPKNEGFKARKSKSKRPTRSKGIKTHGNLENPVKPTRRSNHNSSENTNSGNWIWGYHAILAAIENPKRTLHTLYTTQKMAERMKITPRSCSAEINIVHPSEIDALLPIGAVHQGAALSCAPLPSHFLDEVTKERKGLILVLDQITDPHNVGAMFRLAKAFDARAIIMQDRHAPPLMGATAKVAVGTVEAVPHVLVTNIANTLLELQKKNWRVTGLAGEARINLQQALVNSEAEVIVMGAEGPGLRPRVRKCCDQLAKIPMPGGAESLNVSTAAAIALYEAVRTN